MASKVPADHFDKLFFSLKDLKDKSFSVPFHAPSPSIARRNLAVEAKKASSVLSVFPGDFELYMVAGFNVKTGCYQSVAPAFVCTVLDALKDVSTLEG